MEPRAEGLCGNRHPGASLRRTQRKGTSRCGGFRSLPTPCIVAICDNVWIRRASMGRYPRSRRIDRPGRRVHDLVTRFVTKLP